VLRTLAFWGLVGPVVALPLDALHVATGVLSYGAPTAWMPLSLQAWWAIPLFVGSGLALGLGHRHVATRVAAATTSSLGPLPPATLLGALLGVLALITSYASSGALQAWPWLALAIYAAIWAVAVLLVDARARRALVLHSVGAAVAGPAVEIALSSAGAFHYAHPDVLGVAIWLPGIYLNAGAASHLLDRWLLGRAAIGQRSTATPAHR
jgi:hypothetical protein